MSKGTIFPPGVNPRPGSSSAQGKQTDHRQGTPQAKAFAAPQKRQPPPVPPVYHPQPAPKVLQRKAAQPHPVPPRSNNPRAAHPVYRPQPAPKCLQPKVSNKVQATQSTATPTSCHQRPAALQRKVAVGQHGPQIGSSNNLPPAPTSRGPLSQSKTDSPMRPGPGPVPVPPKTNAGSAATPHRRGSVSTGLQPKMAAVRIEGGNACRILPLISKPNGGQMIKAAVKDSKTPIGSVEIRPAGAGKLEIYNLRVAQEHRRCGVGKLLVNTAIQCARHKGHVFCLEARPSDGSISRQALESMYQRIGFRTVGVSGRGNSLMEYSVGAIQPKVSDIARPRPARVIQRMETNTNHGGFKDSSPGRGGKDDDNNNSNSERGISQEESAEDSQVLIDVLKLILRGVKRIADAAPNLAETVGNRELIWIWNLLKSLGGVGNLVKRLKPTTTNNSLGLFAGRSVEAGLKMIGDNCNNKNGALLCGLIGTILKDLYNVNVNFTTIAQMDNSDLSSAFVKEHLPG
jgi:GNAT superfamily N-acetyltransferase